MLLNQSNDFIQKKSFEVTSISNVLHTKVY